MAEERAPVAKEKKVKTKEKKQRTGRKHESLKIWEYYEVKEGCVERKRKPCPRCGPGTLLSQHKNRFYCGRCGYAQFEKGGVREGTEGEPKEETEVKEDQPAEEAKEEPSSEEHPKEKKKEEAAEEEKPRDENKENQAEESQSS
jgi:small subunit ribosomal protein S27Ae